MKKTKNYLLLLICGIVAAASFSSCFNDNDNDYSIDAATQKKYQTTISTLSPYANNARFYYASNFTVNKYDSIKGNSVYCRFTADSTFQVTGIPVCKLDSAVKVGVNSSTPYTTVLRWLSSKATTAYLSLTGHNRTSCNT